MSMYGETPKLDKLIKLMRHIENVKSNALLIAEKIWAEKPDMARQLIANAYIHDNSKFYGIEWEALVVGDDKLLEKAIAQHHENNPHHPEYYQSICEMPEVYLIECVCDWKARSEEFGTDMKSWLDKICEKYNIGKSSKTFKLIKKYAEMLVEHW